MAAELRVLISRQLACCLKAARYRVLGLTMQQLCSGGLNRVVD